VQLVKLSVRVEIRFKNHEDCGGDIHEVFQCSRGLPTISRVARIMRSLLSRGLGEVKIACVPRPAGRALGVDEHNAVGFDRQLPPSETFLAGQLAIHWGDPYRRLLAIGRV